MLRMKQLWKAGLLAGLLGIGVCAYASPVNINKADAGTLATSIKGIGPAKARAIVEYRHKHGPFKSVNELTRVKGIGEKLILRIKPDLQLKDPAPNIVKH